MVLGKGWKLDVGRYGREGVVCGKGWEGRSVINHEVILQSPQVFSLRVTCSIPPAQLLQKSPGGHKRTQCRRDTVIHLGHMSHAGLASPEGPAEVE